MFNQLISKLKEDSENWEKIKSFFIEASYPAKQILLNEGEKAQYMYFIKKGCLRLWFNNDGKDITFQFFFENQAVSSLESFLSDEPSIFTLQCIEPCNLILIKKNDFEYIFNQPELKNGFQQILFSRMSNYAKLFLSRIKDTPEQRYLDLLENHPEVIKRVQQHYIASYLGITPISLSRIRNKILKK